MSTPMLFSSEHYTLMAQFESEFQHYRLDREHKDLWAKGYIYQNGETNNLFLAYRKGYAYGKLAAR